MCPANKKKKKKTNELKRGTESDAVASVYAGPVTYTENKILFWNNTLKQEQMMDKNRLLERSRFRCPIHDACHQCNRNEVCI